MPLKEDIQTFTNQDIRFDGQFQFLVDYLSRLSRPQHRRVRDLCELVFGRQLFESSSTKLHLNSLEYQPVYVFIRKLNYLGLFSS